MSYYEKLERIRNENGLLDAPPTARVLLLGFAYLAQVIRSSVAHTDRGKEDMLCEWLDLQHALIADQKELL